ncbi:MAG: hypothetical protein Q9177_001278 [Variospora cf. flavescens]
MGVCIQEPNQALYKSIRAKHTASGPLDDLLILEPHPHLARLKRGHMEQDSMASFTRESSILLSPSPGHLNLLPRNQTLTLNSAPRTIPTATTPSQGPPSVRSPQPPPQPLDGYSHGVVASSSASSQARSSNYVYGQSPRTDVDNLSRGFANLSASIGYGTYTQGLPRPNATSQGDWSSLDFLFQGLNKTLTRKHLRSASKIICSSLQSWKLYVAE